MTKARKKLPKAVSRTADDMRRAAESASVFATAAAEHEEAPAVPAPAVAPAVQAQARNGHAATPVLPPIVLAPIVLAPAAGEDAARRLLRATAIVERYSNFSALGGVIPLPLLNVAGVTVIILRMVRRLCDAYNVPYEVGRARALVVGVAGGSVPTTASAVTTSTLVYFVPGVNMLGLAVSSVTASVCTRAIGRRIVEHFETGGDLMDFPVVERRRK